MTLRLNVPDLAFGVFLVALGALAFGLASELTVGTAASMGPGYVPRGLSMLIMVYGLVLGVRAAFTGHEPFPAIAWRPLILISAVGGAVRNSVAGGRPRGHEHRRRGLRGLCRL